MGQKVDKMLNKHMALYELPKRIVRRVRKIIKRENMTLTESFHFIDLVGQKFTNIQEQKDAKD